MEIQFLGAAQTVTGSCHLIDTGSVKILLDCGMFQGSKALKERNYMDFPFTPADIDFVILSHAHIDHSGLLPKLVKHGFKGQIITTRATADLCSIMLPDSGHIQEMEVERKNRKLKRAGKNLLEPIYTAQDAHETMQYFKGVDYDLLINLNENVLLRLRDAGHILGSAIIELFVKENGKTIKLVYTGDLGNKEQPIINNPTYIEEADYVIMESTYGSRLHKDVKNKLEKLRSIIKDTFRRGGNLVIPAFAVERTQDLLYYLNILEQEGELKGIDIVVDSPLAISATEIFRHSIQYYDEESRKYYIKNGKGPLSFPNLTFSRTADESRQLNERKTNTIIISASGMCDAGRIKHHLKHNLWREESTVLFVGYQAEGTLGRRILDGEKKVRIHGEEIAVKAKIEEIDGFSGHADQMILLEWIKSFKKPPKTVFIVHGEADSSKALSELINKEAGFKTIIPKYLESYTLHPVKVEQKAINEQTLRKVTEKELIASFNDMLKNLTIYYQNGFKEGRYTDLIGKFEEINNLLSK
ncbi:MAG: metallo-beta-lactamase family protein [Thermosediminibacterales bacterium]|nr:metallo-beta-lactamase family protein [Thermosediminibacterales bacterium]